MDGQASVLAVAEKGSFEVTGNRLYGSTSWQKR